MQESNLDINLEQNESNLDIKIPKNEKTKRKEKTNKLLQRVDEWFKMRSGKFTGSEIKNLMSSGPGKSKLNWEDLDKIFSFGETALKSIYANAKERESGKYVSSGDGVYQMKYGKIVEPFIQKILKKQFKEKGKLKEVGFKSFPTFENAGSSADMVLFNNENKAIDIVEIKATTNWDAHYKKASLFNVKHPDFWQTIAEMISWDVESGYFVYSEPPRDIAEYINWDGDDRSLFKKFKKECPLTIIEIQLDKVHAKALFKRLEVAEHALNELLKTKEPLSICLDNSVSYFHENQELLIKNLPDNLKTKNVIK